MNLAIVIIGSALAVLAIAEIFRRARRITVDTEPAYDDGEDYS